MAQAQDLPYGRDDGIGASPAAGQAKEIAQAGSEQAKEIGHTAKRRAMDEIDARREQLASEVEKLAGTLEQQGAQGEAQLPLLQYAATAARRLSSALQSRSTEQIFRDVSRSPVAVLAGSFALGFLAVRLFRT